MSVLSDLVAAPATAAEAVGRSSVPSKEFGGVEVKGIDSVKLGTLHALLTGESFDDLLAAYDPVVSVSDDGPWVFELPPPLVQRLAALAEPELSRTAAAWARTEEFAMDGWDPGDVLAVLRDASAIARRAQADGHSLYLWTSL